MTFPILRSYKLSMFLILYGLRQNCILKVHYYARVSAGSADYVVLNAVVGNGKDIRQSVHVH
jgi:hypothetical protein